MRRKSKNVRLRNTPRAAETGRPKRNPKVAQEA